MSKPTFPIRLIHFSIQLILDRIEAVEQEKPPPPNIPPQPDPHPKPKPPVYPRHPGFRPEPISRKEIAVWVLTVNVPMILLILVFHFLGLQPLSISGVVALLAINLIFAYLFRKQHQAFLVKSQKYELELQQYNRDRKSLPRRKQIYHEQYAKYEARQSEIEDWQGDCDRVLSDYKEQCKPYDDAIASLYNDLHSKLRRVVQPPAKGLAQHSTIGFSEKEFQLSLNRYFPGLISPQALLKNNYNPTYWYRADFAYIDPEVPLYIDIEIDEPYGYKTGEPIHFLGRDKDEIRNNFFLSKGWVVIRFAEEQVCLHPKSCCKAIAQVVSVITGEPVPPQLIQVPDLQPILQWTLEEALQMAESNYRNRYL